MMDLTNIGKIIINIDDDDVLYQIKEEMLVDLLDKGIQTINGEDYDPLQIIPKYTILIYCCEVRENFDLCGQIRDLLTLFLVQGLKVPSDEVETMIWNSINLYKEQKPNI